MAIIKAFKAIRPVPELIDKVAALPYDVMNSDEAREMVQGNPYSFLHVDKAEIDLDQSVGLYERVVYERASSNLKAMLNDGVMMKEARNSLYIYRLIMDGREQRGLVVCTSIDDYMNDVIKKHEHTRADKEQDRINHVDFCNANTGPIFLTYRTEKKVDEVIGEWMETHNPIYDFTSEDGIAHTVWLINCDETIRGLVKNFEAINYLYIADGHHRAASAVKVGLKRREQKPEYDGSEEFNYFLSVLFPSDQLRIFDYNRIVKDLNSFSPNEFIEKVKENFDVVEYEAQGQFRPSERHTFGMFLEGKWYILRAREGTFDENDTVQRLDVSILQNNLLSPILGIKDPRKDKRIDFVGGIRGLKELETRVQNGMKVAFSMYPTTIEDLIAIADEGKVMPPKSTWFEPKLRSGIFIHELE